MGGGYIRTGGGTYEFFSLRLALVAQARGPTDPKLVTFGGGKYIYSTVVKKQNKIKNTVLIKDHYKIYTKHSHLGV